MKKNVVAGIAVIALVGLAGLGAWTLTSLHEPNSGAHDSVIIGGPKSDGATLVFAAEDKHFFEANNINSSIKEYATGPEAINALMNNEIDIAGTAEYPIAAGAFQNDNISIIASFSRLHNEYLVGRVDKGIKNISDLKGKKIGLPLGAIPEFYLGRFLNLQGMSIQDVILVNMLPGQMAGAISNGSVDAVVAWEPYISQMQEQNAGGLVSWEVHNEQPTYSVFVCRNDWIKEHPDLIRRFLNSIAQTEDFMAQNPDEAKAILKKHYQYTDAYIKKVWPENQFSLSLDESLILAMEDEGRWMIANNLTNATKIPDYRSHIYSDGLKKVRPESVNIISLGESS